jgi:hypothetical protein
MSGIVLIVLIGIYMAKPFATDPKLSSHFPSSDELRNTLSGVPRASREIVARLWVTEGLPSAFLNAPAVYEDIRGWLGSRLGVHAKEITLIGSARIGYSLAPPPDYGRPFSEKSDLDLSIISGSLFQRVTSAFDSFAVDYKTEGIKPRSQHERELWDGNIKFGDRNIPKGFFDPDKVPNFNRYPIAQCISQSMWMLLKRLEATPNAPQVRHASVRVYRDWQSFINRVSFNLLSALG